MKLFLCCPPLSYAQFRGDEVTNIQDMPDSMFEYVKGL
jgi:hypothetical protein